MVETGIDYVAEAERELAEFDAAAGQLGPRDRRRHRGPSLVYSVRLEIGEIEALERRAVMLGLRPSALARNLIRAGLAQHGGATAPGPVLSEAVDRLEDLVAELRALVP